MIRIQIYLPKSLYQRIALVAQRERKPKSAVIREVLEQGMIKREQNAGEALLRLSKLGIGIKGLPKDLSTNIDKYLYEEA